MATPGRDAARRVAQMQKLSDEMARLERQIDTAGMGSPERLALLRRQASVSDARQTLMDRRAR